MNENNPTAFEKEEMPIEGEKEKRVKRIIFLVETLSASLEKIPFPGIQQDSYDRHKAFEKEMPGFSTPVDVLIERFSNEGMKVMLGKNPQSGNVFLLPRLSDDMKNDCLLPEQLQIPDDMDSVLRELITLCKKK